MHPALIFLLGGGTALVLKEPLKRASRGVVKGAVRVGLGVSRAISSVQEDLQDVAAEVERERLAKKISPTESTPAADKSS